MSQEAQVQCDTKLIKSVDVKFKQELGSFQLRARVILNIVFSSRREPSKKK